MINVGDMVNPSQRAYDMYDIKNMGVRWPCKVVNVFNDGNKTVAQFLCNDPYNKYGGITLRSWDVRSLEVADTRAKIHVTSIMSSAGVNSAKARDGAGTVYEFVDGKWHLWSRNISYSTWSNLMPGHPERKRYDQPIGMFIRMEV